MSSPEPPLRLAALLRFALEDARRRIYAGVADAGYRDIRPAHITLFRWPGPEGRRPTEIAAGGQISKQRANDLLRDLERLGYLELEPDPTDSRARIIRLTERGADVYAITSAIQSEIEQDWAESIGPDDVERVREGLRRVVEEGPSYVAARRGLRGDPSAGRAR